MQVVTSGAYEVVAIYTSQISATFKLAVGSFPAIQAGTAPALKSKLPPLVRQD